MMYISFGKNFSATQVIRTEAVEATSNLGGNCEAHEATKARLD